MCLGAQRTRGPTQEKAGSTQCPHMLRENHQQGDQWVHSSRVACGTSCPLNLARRAEELGPVVDGPADSRYSCA